MRFTFDDSSEEVEVVDAIAEPLILLDDPNGPQQSEGDVTVVTAGVGESALHEAPAESNRLEIPTANQAGGEEVQSPLPEDLSQSGASAPTGKDANQSAKKSFESDFSKYQFDFSPLEEQIRIRDFPDVPDNPWIMAPRQPVLEQASAKQTTSNSTAEADSPLDLEKPLEEPLILPQQPSDTQAAAADSGSQGQQVPSFEATEFRLEEVASETVVLDPEGSGQGEASEIGAQEIAEALVFPQESDFEDLPFEEWPGESAVEEPLILSQEPSRRDATVANAASLEQEEPLPETTEFRLEEIAPEVEIAESQEADFSADGVPATPDTTEPLILSGESAAGEPATAVSRHGTNAEKKPKEETSAAQKPGKGNLLTRPLSLNLFCESNKLLGLDIGSRTIKFIVLKRSSRGLRLLDCGIQPMVVDFQEEDGEEKERLIAQILDTHLREKSLKNAIITSAVSGLEVLFHHIQLPRIANKDLNQAVTWACRKDLPFPIESSVVEYRVLANSGNRTESKLDILVVAAQEHLVSRHLGMLERAKIRPSKISTVPAALWKLSQSLPNSKRQDNYAIIEIGGKSSHIVFVQHGQLQFAREITIASHDFTEALTSVVFSDGQEFRIDGKLAEQIKREYGFPRAAEEQGHTKEGIPVKEISVMLRPVLERLVNEIHRTIEFYKEKFRADEVAKVFLTGAGALLAHLDERLAEELKIGVEILNPFQIIATKEKINRQALLAIGPRFAVATGLALDQEKTLNFLPDKLKGARTFRILKKLLRYLTVIVFLILIFFSENISKQNQRIAGEFKRFEEQYERMEPKRKQFVALRNKLAKLRKINKQYQDRIVVNLTLARHLKALSNLVPTNVTLTAFRVEYRNTKANEKKNAFKRLEFLILEGVAFEDHSMEGVNLANFLFNLEKSNYFSSIALRDQRIRKDGSLAFTLECQI